MMFRVPAVPSSDFIVKIADVSEVESANNLVVANYVACNYWEATAKNLENPFVHSVHRKIIVAYEAGELVGTISLILDSPDGLPSDCAQRDILNGLRARGGCLAEVSGFAMKKNLTANRKHALFLVSYVLQYAYYYAGVDRLAASAIAPHAKFYESALGFSMISGPTRYRDDGIAPFFYLLTLDLGQAHKAIDNEVRHNDMRRFFLVDEQPGQQYPAAQQQRPRQGRPVREAAA